MDIRRLLLAALAIAACGSLFAERVVMMDGKERECIFHALYVDKIALTVDDKTDDFLRKDIKGLVFDDDLAAADVMKITGSGFYIDNKLQPREMYNGMPVAGGPRNCVRLLTKAGNSFEFTRLGLELQALVFGPESTYQHEKVFGGGVVGYYMERVKKDVETGKMPATDGFAAVRLVSSGITDENLAGGGMQDALSACRKAEPLHIQKVLKIQSGQITDTPEGADHAWEFNLKIALPRQHAEDLRMHLTWKYPDGTVKHTFDWLTVVGTASEHELVMWEPGAKEKPESWRVVFNKQDIDVAAQSFGKEVGAGWDKDRKVGELKGPNVHEQLSGGAKEEEAEEAADEKKDDKGKPAKGKDPKKPAKKKGKKAVLPGVWFLSRESPPKDYKRRRDNTVNGANQDPTYKKRD